MKYRFHDSGLGRLAGLARAINAVMDGDADNKTTKEALTGFITDLKGLLSTAKDGPTAVAAFNDSLIKDNYNLRESRRTLKADLAKAQKLPDGALVIQGDDVKLFQGFKAFNMKPEDVGTVLVEYDNLKVGQIARDSADALGWKFPVLKKLIESQGLDIEMKEVEVEEEDPDNKGKKIKSKKQMPYVTTEDNKSVALSEFEPMKDFHASLIKDEEGAGAAGRTTQGVRMPAQGATSSNGRGKGKGNELTSVVTSTLDSRYKRPEPAKK